ncbi:hypothetical protein EK21DRAFT_89587 [Setomelanomma holmii]|uniref:Uncharacterized protein n=1 Tax=Setomelanomma holmii TaxID=210430 RepID=A0A9P4H9Q0_9PLEO|nr:hypothetical protein EK21DRAFT_89587 [Setomelanomma holmii]
MPYLIPPDFLQFDTDTFRTSISKYIDRKVDCLMALNTIRKRLNEDYDALSLLDALPPHTSFQWICIPSHSHMAIQIGNVKDRDILAFLVQLGDKPYEVRYWSVQANRPVSGTSHTVLSQDDVVRLSLFAPFKYNADTSKSSKRKFSIIIKWYFMLRGLLHDGVGGDYNDYCKRLCDALRKIYAGQQMDKDRGRRGDQIEGSRQTPMTVDESPEPDEPKSPYRLRSAPQTIEKHVRLSPQECIATPAKTPTSSSKDDKTDYDRLRSFLDSHGILYLLDNIPEANAMQFVTQGFIPEAQPKKLFLGRHYKNDCEIYAYMRPSRDWHEIKFTLEDPRRPLNITQMRTEDVAKQRLLHPFNKTFPKDGPIDQGDRARLTLMVKWYFIAAGIATNLVLQETKAYPGRLRCALEYIANRMGPAAAKPPMTRDASIPRRSRLHDTSTIDESQIQNSLAGPTSSPPHAGQSLDLPAPSSSTTSRSTRHKPNIPTTTPNIIQTTTTLPSHPSPRGTKRPAPATTSSEDADFASLAATLSQDQSLTKQINAIDEELEKLERKKEIFMEAWEKEHKGVVERRGMVEEERGGVRKRFKRISLKVAGGGEE